ncbi:MAG: SDR family NAD(P)-dependent oxidoreductase [Rhodobacteraceae bacterium]|nr:SDR family NAD(P)-dependent oxidoreductase [Paracoccaceae bacterium]
MDAFEGRVALITGASRGFGFAVATAFASRGTHVISVGRTVGALESLDDRIRELGGGTTLVPLDIRDADGVGRLCSEIRERWQHLDFWVHTAVHAPPLSPIAHSFQSDLTKCLEINVVAVAGLIGAITPLLTPTTGTVVHVDDQAHGGTFHGAYSASKAAQRILFETWRDEAAVGHERLLTFSPCPMPTGVRARFYPGEDRSSLASPEQQAEKLTFQFNSMSPAA